MRNYSCYLSVNWFQTFIQVCLFHNDEGLLIMLSLRKTSFIMAVCSGNRTLWATALSEIHWSHFVGVVWDEVVEVVYYQQSPTPKSGSEKRARWCYHHQQERASVWVSEWTRTWIQCPKHRNWGSGVIVGVCARGITTRPRWRVVRALGYSSVVDKLPSAGEGRERRYEGDPTWVVYWWSWLEDTTLLATLCLGLTYHYLHFFLIFIITPYHLGEACTSSQLLVSLSRTLW